MKKSYSRVILASILVSVLSSSITACASDATQIHEDVVGVVDTTENVPSVTSEQSIQSEQIEELQLVSADDETEYVFRCVDENGDPVTGVTLQICTDETCTLVKTDETGVVKYAEKPYEYDVHVYRYDEGYELVSDAEFKTDDVYGAYDIKFVKK